MYRALRPLLFCLEAERAHALSIAMLRAAGTLHLQRAVAPAAAPPVTLMGLTFANRIGLAAGFDKSGSAVNALGALGFGFLEIGTVTPRAQSGNPRPRVFRLPAVGAIINRMGFPNPGAAALAARLARRSYRGICGINIGKNADTPMQRATRDYVAAMRMVYECADYIAINVSSPNTSGLRRLQQGAQLEPLLAALMQTREELHSQTGRRVPLAVKLAPDLSDEALAASAAILKALRIDAVIATNSTLQRPGVAGQRHAAQAGGLSGAPLHALSVAMIRRLRGLLGPDLPIIGVGGIASVQEARATFGAGADLIQLYTGLVYEGPQLLRALLRHSWPEVSVHGI